MKKFYITTAIDYVNGKPHIGHAYEKVLADVIARAHRLLGDDVHFLTGLDMHGQKVQQSATKANLSPEEFSSEMAQHFVSLFKRLNISYDNFIRTTDDRHMKVVQKILQTLFDKGEIYAADYRGWYSARQEQFLTEKDMVDGKFPEEYGEVVPLTERNYFFRLTKYKEWLVNYVNSTPSFVYPDFRHKAVTEFLKNDINDLCISRPKTRLSWGIELPFDKDYVTYVWFDALVNYISAVGYGEERLRECWPADYHVIGKDILVPPHAVYWPVMLHAIGVELPKTLLTHGWWNKDNSKMSKSLGNVVDPLALIDQYGPDAFRYFVLREMILGQDSNFSEEVFASRYNSDLANDLGNLVNRSLSMVHRYRQGSVPKPGAITPLESELRSVAEAATTTFERDIRSLQLNSVLNKTWALITRCNQYVDQAAPWKLARDTASTERLDTVLYHLTESVRIVSLLISPFVPETAEKIRAQLNLPIEGRKIFRAVLLGTNFSISCAWSACSSLSEIG